MLRQKLDMQQSSKMMLDDMVACNFRTAISPVKSKVQCPSKTTNASHSINKLVSSFCNDTVLLLFLLNILFSVHPKPLVPVHPKHF